MVGVVRVVRLSTDGQALKKKGEPNALEWVATRGGGLGEKCHPKQCSMRNIGWIARKKRGSQTR